MNLKLPLAIINESVNLVSDSLAGNSTDEQKELLEIVKRNTERLGRLINNVLDYQKIRAGKMFFTIRENDLNNIVLEVYESMKIMVKEKNLDFILKLDDNLPQIRLDKGKIIQVITNLESNAIKYTETGNITISTERHVFLV